MEKVSTVRKVVFGLATTAGALSIGGAVSAEVNSPVTTECIERESDYPPTPPCNTVPPEETVPTTVPATTPETTVVTPNLPETGSNNVGNTVTIAGITFGAGVLIAGLAGVARRRNA